MSDFVQCKDCSGGMKYVENKRMNEFYITKVDTWVCQRCGRTIEEKRLDKSRVFK